MGIISTAFGIDLGPNHLVLTLLKKSFGRIKVVDYSQHRIPPEEEREEREAQIIGLVNTFASRHSIKRDCAHLSLPRQGVIARFIRLPMATRENLGKVLEYELTKYTPFKREDVFYDYVLLKEEKEGLTLFAVFAKRSDIESTLSLLKKIGIRPASIQISTTSALNLFFYNRTPEEGEVSVLIDLNHSHFEMNLLRGTDWRESYPLPFHAKPWESEILWAYERSGVRPVSNAPLRFYLYGEGGDDSRLTALQRAGELKEVLRPPLEQVVIHGDRKRLAQIYASLGTPLSGLIKPRIDLNLLPFEWRKKKRKIGKPILIGLIILLILVGLNYGVSLYLRYRDELASISEELRRRKPEVEAVERLQRERERLAKEIAELEKFKSEEVSKIEMLREVTRLLPDTAWIWNLKYNGREVELSGYAESASDLIPILDKSPLFEKVEFLAPVTKERLMRPEGPQEKERFRIKARLEARRPGA